MRAKVFLLSCLAAILLASCGTSKNSSATADRETYRDRRTVLLADLKKKANKQAQKEASSYKKEGYRTFVGDLPLDKQIENAWLKSVDLNERGFPEYIVGNAQVTAGNITAGKSQALHAAKVEVASLMSSMIASLIESSVSNNELSSGEATTLNKYVQATKELVVADLGQVHKEVEVYRELPNKNVHVITRVSYSSALAMDAAKKRMQKEMSTETQALHQKLDKVFNLDRLQPESNSSVKLDAE